MTTIHCDEESCEAEMPQNHADQWVSITVDVHDVKMEIHFCPTCWSKILIRRALTLTDHQSP